MHSKRYATITTVASTDGAPGVLGCSAAKVRGTGNGDDVLLLEEVKGIFLRRRLSGPFPFTFLPDDMCVFGRLLVKVGVQGRSGEYATRTAHVHVTGH
jgi:hypothetical protein